VGAVKKLFEGICEAGIALIKNLGIAGRDLEATVSGALADLLQVHAVVDGPADSGVAGIIGR
jgi:hypothetical protein